jgi:hypothetical protein
MMALTIRQPWAWAIAVAGKDVENRTWHTGYRGPLAIHAALAEDAPDSMPGAARRAYDVAAFGQAPAATLGAIIAVAELAGCHLRYDLNAECNERRICSQWAVPAQWHWQLASVLVLARPVIVRGRLGLWPVPAVIARQVAAEIGARS